MGRVATELRRKSAYMATGLAALLLRWLSPLEAAAAAAAAFVLCGVLAWVRGRRGGPIPGDGVRGGSAALLTYSLAVLGLILVFRSRLELAAAAWALTAIGDGMATVAGLTLRGPRLPWNPAKTWWGFLGFVLYGTCSSALLVRWVQHGRLDGGGAIGPSFLGFPSAPLWSDLTFLVLGCAGASVAAALAESLDAGVDDSLLVAAVGGASIYAATLVEPARLLAAWDLVQTALPRGALAAGAVAAALLALRAARVPGAATVWIFGTLLWWLGGWRAFLLLALSAAIAAACARLGGCGAADDRPAGLGASAVAAQTASGAVAGVLFAFLAEATPHRAAFVVALVAALATTAAGSVASAFGRPGACRRFLLPTFRRAPAGDGGRVCVEGALAAVLAAAAIGGVAWGVSLAPAAGLWIAPAGAIVGLALEPALVSARRRSPSPGRELPGLVGILAGALAAVALASLARI